MMKTKQLTRLWSLMLLLMAMLVPGQALAQNEGIQYMGTGIVIDGDVTITVNTDWSEEYEMLEINGSLTISEGVTLTAPQRTSCLGTVNNYGTFSGSMMSNSGTVNNYGGTISFGDWNGTAYVDMDMNTHDWSEWTTIEEATTTKFGTDTRSCPGDASHAAHSEARIRYRLLDASFTPTPYSGTPATPQRITSDNYSDYGFTTSNYQLYEDWYAITAAEELFGYASLGASEGNNAILLNDIVINADGDDTYTWTPYYLRYNTFDGAGHTISGMKVDYSNSFAGLFGALNHSAVVKNLGVVNSTVTTTEYYAGGIAGKVFSNNTITNCYAMNVAVTAGLGSVGGITGANDGTVSNCFAVATLTGSNADFVSGFGGDKTNSYGAATLAELEGAATGELCYKLNNEATDGTQAWYQTLGTDNYPVLTNTGSNTVYYGYANCEASEPIYSNTEFYATSGHDYVNGTCTRCGDELTSITNYAFADGTAYTRATAADVATLTYTRTVTDAQVGKWQALYVPFQMSYSDWSNDFDVAAINNFHEYSDENGDVQNVELEVRLVKSGKLKANHPYLIRPKSAGEKTITLTDAPLAAAESTSISCASVERRYTFTGIYQPMTGMQTGDYMFISGGSICDAESDEQTLKAQRWYLTIEDLGSQWESEPAAAAARRMSISVIGEEDATAIEEIRVTSSTINAATAAAIYDIQGRRIGSTVKGVNIIRQADGSTMKVMVK